MMLAASEVSAGRMSVGDLVMVQGLVFQLTLPLNILGTVYNQVRQAATDMQAMQRLQQLRPEVASHPDAPPLVLTHGGRVQFDNVYFRYGAAEPRADGSAAADGGCGGGTAAAAAASDDYLLRGVSFSVEPGQTVAIVGTSGSGKSSILRLLCRFYDPQSGRVTIDGHDLRDVDLDSVRAVLGVVPQDVVLFNDTVEYNLRYGRLEATADEVRQAATIARIHDAIERMPSGYATLVGERGLKLSGGEKQRIALARALLRDAPVLLCDEATSAVDTVTERSILDGLRSHARRPERPRQTCIMVAHRLSTVVDADRIIVLSQGRVAETGTHAELVALGGQYATMWAMQLQAAQRSSSQTSSSSAAEVRSGS